MKIKTENGNKENNMATSYHDFTGRAYWSKLHPEKPDEYRGSNFWITTLVMDEDSLKEYYKLGLADNSKPVDIDGEKGYCFRRQLKKVFNGVEETFDPVKIESWNDETKSFEPFPNLDMDEQSLGLGNGTKIRLNCSVYSHANGVGVRMIGITVLDHVPYSSKGGEKSAGERNTNVTKADVGDKPW